MKAGISIFKTALLCLFSALYAALPVCAGESPGNIILMIGDGMGVAHLTAGHVVKGKLEMERMRIGGLLKTYSADKLVTDSAAASTAMATGYRTNNRMVSMSPEGERLKTLLEHAGEKGKAAGIVVTCSVTHATPAAFYAHVPNRQMTLEIAEQAVKAQLDLLVGGGWGDFLPKSHEGGRRDDDKNLVEALEADKRVITDEQEFLDLKGGGPVVALLASNHLLRASQRNISLAQMVAKSLEILDAGTNGFVLVVEGSQIDWAGHANDEKAIIEEVIEFDDAVGVALNFAEKDGRTLVVVTADHETGGMVLLDGSKDENSIIKSQFGTKGHSATMVPVFAYGPGGEEFGGIRDISFIGSRLISFITESE